MGEQADSGVTTVTTKPTPTAKHASRLSQPRQQTARVALLVLVCATVGFGGGYLGAGSREQTATSSGGVTINKQDQAQARSESQLISAIAKKVSPSVVSVNVVGQAQDTRSLGGYQRSAGTGIIISDDGYIITNRHVVPAGTSKVSVTLSDGSELTDVTVVGRTTSSDSLDIAFLKIGDTKGKKLQKANLGDSSHVQVGDKVVAIGNALGQFQNTVTDGIISGFGRDLQAGDGAGGDVESLQNLFQTDAAINEGNSGGPLLNIEGEVIGINTAVAGGTAQNIGFAIPINDVKSLIQSVLQKGKLERPYLGVRYVSLTDDVASQYKLSVKRGAYILPAQNGSASVLPDSPADKAGLKEKDIITKVDGVEVDQTNSLTSLIGRKAVGDTVTLTVLRDGKELTTQAVLQPYPSDNE